MRRQAVTLALVGSNPPPADPPDGLLLNPDDPLPSARAWLHRAGHVGQLWHRAGVFYRYGAPGYADLEDGKLREELYTFLEHTVRLNQKTGRFVPFQPTRTKVDVVLDALRALCHFAASAPAPCWLADSPREASECVALQNGILHIPTRTLLPPDPAFFTLNTLPFAYAPDAAEPVRWLRFCDQLWPDEPEPIATLQEFIGYLLTAHTHYQKILMLVGPKRSGKGTIGRVIRQLLGAGNVCSPTLGTIGGNFGRTSLIGKTAAIIADARISGRTDTAAVTECLLSISGEDPQSIPRKYLPDWNGTLGVRFLLMTNELPKIEDASGALASRFLIIPLTESWFGREEVTLFDTLVSELPGIFNWALEGWARLSARGKFVAPSTSARMVQEFEDLGSPIGAFLRECCTVRHGASISQPALFQAWKDWCKDSGRDHPGTVQILGRNLAAQIPWLGESRPVVMGKRVRFYEGVQLKDPE